MVFRETNNGKIQFIELACTARFNYFIFLPSKKVDFIKMPEKQYENEHIPKKNLIYNFAIADAALQFLRNCIGGSLNLHTLELDTMRIKLC